MCEALILHSVGAGTNFRCNIDCSSVIIHAVLPYTMIELKPFHGSGRRRAFHEMLQGACDLDTIQVIPCNCCPYILMCIESASVKQSDIAMARSCSA